MKSGSIFTDRLRKMYLQDPKTKKAKCNDVIGLDLEQNSGLIFPEIAVLEDNVYVTL